MSRTKKIFEPELYTYNDYKHWKGDWELLNGHPVAMSPSPKRGHQFVSGKFFRQISNLLEKEKLICNCEAYYELDWIVSDDTVVCPDCMIVCGEFKDDFLTFPPQLILEVSSHSTRLRDRNTKYKLYEMYGVKYYIIADSEKNSIEIFELVDNQYKQTDTTHFKLTPTCSFEFNSFGLFD